MPMVYKHAGRLRHPRLSAYIGDNSSDAASVLKARAAASGAGSQASALVDNFMSSLCAEYRRTNNEVPYTRMVQLATEAASRVDLSTLNPASLILLVGDLAAAAGSFRAGDICSYNAGSSGATTPAPSSGGIDTTTALFGVLAIVGAALLIRKVL